MSDYGIRASKIAKDVFTDNIDDMIFSSNTYLLKTIATGSYSFVGPSGGPGVTTTVGVAHGLGYRPTVIAYWSRDNISWQSTGYRYSGGTFIYPGGATWSSNGYLVEAGSTASSITTTVYDIAGSGATIYIRYIIYIDTLG